ncbi:MAG: molybdate ABC transporter substrate-binding protein [Rickettsiales bacterium]|nr:molybdate ABC transporter substrate-binding protein [Rickettsiales bacterium]
MESLLLKKQIYGDVIKKNLRKTFFILFFICSLPDNSLASVNRNLTVFAEQNTVAALTKLSRIYSQKNHVIVAVNFNSSAELISDIDSGEPADIFISAHTGWIETLKQKGLVDVYNTGHIARDKMVLVTSKDNHNINANLKNSNLTIEEALKILDQQKAYLIIDQEGSSSGKYSKELVKSLELNNLQLFTKLSEDKSEALDLTGDNVEHYAILLKSQIKNKKNLQVLAEQKDSNIFYQALVIAGDNMETAREFLKFLKSNAAKSILRDNGFITD